MSRNARGTTAWDDELRNWPEGQREWAELAAASMLFADAAQDDIGPALAELRQTVSASGQTPTELFGEPVHYGRIRRRLSGRCARHGNIAVSPARKTTSPRISGTSSCSPRNLPPAPVLRSSAAWCCAGPAPAFSLGASAWAFSLNSSRDPSPRGSSSAVPCGCALRPGSSGPGCPSGSTPTRQGPDEAAWQMPARYRPNSRRTDQGTGDGAALSPEDRRCRR